MKKCSQFKAKQIFLCSFRSLEEDQKIDTKLIEFRILRRNLDKRLFDFN